MAEEGTGGEGERGEGGGKGRRGKGRGGKGRAPMTLWHVAPQCPNPALYTHFCQGYKVVISEAVATTLALTKLLLLAPVICVFAGRVKSRVVRKLKLLP